MIHLLEGLWMIKILTFDLTCDVVSSILMVEYYHLFPFLLNRKHVCNCASFNNKSLRRTEDKYTYWVDEYSKDEKGWRQHLCGLWRLHWKKWRCSGEQLKLRIWDISFLLRLLASNLFEATSGQCLIMPPGTSARQFDVPLQHAKSGNQSEYDATLSK